MAALLSGGASELGTLPCSLPEVHCRYIAAVPMQSKLVNHCRRAQDKECKKHTHPVLKVSLALETKHRMLKQQEQKGELKAKGVESRREVRRTTGTSFFMIPRSSLWGTGGLHTDTSSPCSSKRCLFHFICWYPAPEVATAYKCLLLSRHFWPLSPLPVCLTVSLSPLLY